MYELTALDEVGYVPLADVGAEFLDGGWAGEVWDLLPGFGGAGLCGSEILWGGDGEVNHFIREILHAQVHPKVRPGLFHQLEDLMPEAGHLSAFQAAFVMHAKLNAVDLREDFEEPGERGLCVGSKVVRRHPPNQPGQARVR
jgi:hypothetical protein